MNNPLVSIIIPTFNRAHLIQETLNSILAQTFINWECIIIDDGSTDNTSEIVGDYVVRDLRFQYYHRPENRPRGGNGARNYGFEISNGEYIIFFDSDDLMHPNKIGLQLDSLIKNSEKDFSISQSVLFLNKKENIVNLWNVNLYNETPVDSFITKEIGWSILAPLWKKESLLKKNIRFDEQLKNGQDFKFHIEALLSGLKSVIIDDTLNFIRSHDNQIKISKNKSKSKMFIFMYLYKNRDRLNKKTNDYVKKVLMILVRKLYIEKKNISALKLSGFMLRNEFSFKIFITLLHNAFFGNFYFLTNRGYMFLSSN